MAYARRRGRQILIVQGERDPGTGTVEQRVLLTLYSKEEARAALAPDEPSGHRLEGLMRSAHPEVRLDWKSLRRQIRPLLPVLPDTYDYGEARLRARFRDGLRAFAHQLALADPQDLVSSARLVKEHRHELEWMADLIRWRVRLCEQSENEWNRDDAFHWRFTIRGREMPHDVEEHAADLWEKRDLERAEPVFRLLGECFPEDPECHNYLGLIALEQERVDDAAGRFRKTIELGRRMFPKRIARESYWRDDRTRPYMRGLRNLALTLCRAGHWDEALGLCDRLEQECDDRIAAMSHRAAVFLNTGRWPEAAGAASYLREIDPSESLVAAFALFETGRRRDSLASFLHGAITHPCATRMLLGRSNAKPRSRDDAQDYNIGVDLTAALHAYLKARRPRASLLFFRRVLAEPKAAALLAEMEDVRRKWRQERGPDRTALDRMTVMRSWEFACEQAGVVAKALGLAEEATPAQPVRRRQGAPRVH